MNVQSHILNKRFVKLSSVHLTSHTMAGNDIARAGANEMLNKTLSTQKPLDLRDHRYDINPSVKKTINKGVDLASHFKKMKPLGYPGRPGRMLPGSNLPEMTGLVYKGHF